MRGVGQPDQLDDFYYILVLLNQVYRCVNNYNLFPITPSSE